MTIALLQEQINTHSDAKLRGRIDERLDPLRQDVGKLRAITFMATETAQTAQQVEITMSAVDLVNVLADAAFLQRRDQARNKATRDFLEKVAAAGIEI